MSDTLPHAGTGAFSGGLKNTGAEPQASEMLRSSSTGQIKFKLEQNGVHIGWLGLKGSQDMWWAVVAEAEATTWEWYTDTSGSYLKNPAWKNGYGTWSSSLWGHPCACNDWAHAGTFKLDDKKHMMAGDGTRVGRYKSDSPYLYANSDYPAVEFTQVDVP